MAEEGTRKYVKRGPFAGLPHPSEDRLTVYGLGPGFGESVVIRLPDGLWMIVDGCAIGTLNLPLALLDAFEQDDVDLLVITHPDEDHIRGLNDIVRQKRVPTIWRYPHGSVVRDFLAGQLNRNVPSPDERLKTLFGIHEVIHQTIKTGRAEVHSGGVDSLRWTGTRGEYEIVSIAPTSHDAQRMQAQFDKLIDVREHGGELSERMLAFLQGDRRWSDHPNAVSLGIVIRWGEVKLLLGGDIERGTRHVASGWKGVIRRLRGDGRSLVDRLALLRDMTFVKVAHHGSKNALDDSAWALHAQSRPVPLGLIMPFDTHGLPDAEALSQLCGRLTILAVTCAGVCHPRVVESGWTSMEPDRMAIKIPMVALEFTHDGAVNHVSLGGSAGLFTHV